MATTVASATTVQRQGTASSHVHTCLFAKSQTGLCADVITNNQDNNVTDNIFQKIGVNLHQ